MIPKILGKLTKEQYLEIQLESLSYKIRELEFKLADRDLQCSGLRQQLLAQHGKEEKRKYYESREKMKQSEKDYFEAKEKILGHLGENLKDCIIDEYTYEVKQLGNDLNPSENVIPTEGIHQN